MASWGTPDASSTPRTAVVHEVHIDGLAVLKMVKHCKDALPNLVSGALLGLDQKGVLEVTHSFPGVSSSSASGAAAGAGAAAGQAAAEGFNEEDYVEHDQEYQLEMMTSLREVNVDNNRVGWYQSMFLGTYNSFKLIQNLASYHESIPNSVVILYDPVQTAKGSLTIRAFRLSEAFVEMSQRAMNEFLPPDSILEELPLKIRNPGLVAALLVDLKAESALACSFDRLDLGTNPYLEKNLEYLSAWVDDLANEQYKFQQEIKRDKWRKKQKEAGLASDMDDGEFAAPDRLASLLVSNQISEYCRQVHNFAGTSFGKLFAASALQKTEAGN